MPSAETLKSRRETILKECIAAEKDRTSGWHPANHGAEEREKRGELPLSERIIALQDDTEIYVVGADCGRVVEAAAKWVIDAEARIAAAPGSFRVVEHAVKCVGRLLAKIGEGLGQIKMNPDCVLGFSTQEWNGILLALSDSNIQVVTAGVAS